VTSLTLERANRWVLRWVSEGGSSQLNAGYSPETRWVLSLFNELLLRFILGTGSDSSERGPSLPWQNSHWPVTYSITGGNGCDWGPLKERIRTLKRTKVQRLLTWVCHPFICPCGAVFLFFLYIFLTIFIYLFIFGWVDWLYQQKDNR